MGFWPFGGGRKSRPHPAGEKTRSLLSEKENPDNMARLEGAGNKASERTTRNNSRRGRDEKSSRQSKSRTASYQSSALTAPPRSVATPLSTRPDGGTEKARDSPVDSRLPPSALYHQNPMSQSSIGPDHFSATPQTPTLHAKRSDHNPSLPRRKSSKRKAEEYAREREVRAMSSPIPIPKRPATYSGSGPLRRDTKSIPGDLNRQFHRPTSEVSLPLPGDLSDMDDLSHQNSFKIGMLSALSPRPTLRYESNPRSAAGKQPARPNPVHQIIEEEDMSSTRRIDELADHLDSGGLRELMEKDRKKREKKKAADRAKLQQKLQRRSERQREEEEIRRKRAEAYVSDSRTRLERGEDDDPTSFELTRPSGEHVEATDHEMDSTVVDVKPPHTDPFADPVVPQTAPPDAIRNPFADEKDIDVMQDPSDQEEEEPPLPVKSPLRQVPPLAKSPELRPSQAAISPPTSPIQPSEDRQSLSQASALARETTPDVAESATSDRHPSDQSSQRLSLWTSFFRRGVPRKPSISDRGRKTPSEFSNTSRESFARKQPPPVVPPRSFKRSESGVPQRTMSKFREDLPELPLSPPDSRLQSPEATTAPPLVAISPSSHEPSQALPGAVDPASLANNSSNPTLDPGRPDSKLYPRKSSDIDMTGTSATGGALSQSLASVDSEGSWLSGKPVKRSSGVVGQPLPESHTTPEPQAPIVQGDLPSADQADRGLKNLSQELTPSPEPAKLKEELPKDFKEDEAATSGGEEEDDGGDSDTGEVEIHETSPIMRATSVEYRGHARHISAGSARLLDIRRASIQSTDTPPRSPALPKTMPLAETGAPAALSKAE